MHKYVLLTCFKHINVISSEVCIVVVLYLILLHQSSLCFVVDPLKIIFILLYE